MKQHRPHDRQGSSDRYGCNSKQGSVDFYKSHGMPRSTARYVSSSRQRCVKRRVSDSNVRGSKVHKKGCRKNKDTRTEVPRDHKVKESSKIPYSEPSQKITAMKKLSRQRGNYKGNDSIRRTIRRSRFGRSNKSSSSSMRKKSRKRID